jgi:hypothetical protein
MDNNTNSAIAILESKIDMLETELTYLNEMLVRVGFPEGIETLKMTVEEVLQEDALKEHHI